MAYPWLGLAPPFLGHHPYLQSCPCLCLAPASSLQASSGTLKEVDERLGNMRAFRVWHACMHAWWTAISISF